MSAGDPLALLYGAPRAALPLTGHPSHWYLSIGYLWRSFWRCLIVAPAPLGSPPEAPLAASRPSPACHTSRAAAQAVRVAESVRKVQSSRDQMQWIFLGTFPTFLVICCGLPYSSTIVCLFVCLFYLFVFVIPGQSVRLFGVSVRRSVFFLVGLRLACALWALWIGGSTAGVGDPSILRRARVDPPTKGNKPFK